jgi:hypothetical protein
MRRKMASCRVSQPVIEKIYNRQISEHSKTTPIPPFARSTDKMLNMHIPAIRRPPPPHPQLSWSDCLFMARGGIFPFSGFYFYTSARPHSVAAGALHREIYRNGRRRMWVIYVEGGEGRKGVLGSRQEWNGGWSVLGKWKRSTQE